MSTVTITDTIPAAHRHWVSPGTKAWGVSNSPIGEQVFADLAFAIAIKASTDENFVITSCTLPPGFVYRLRHLSYLVAGISLADLDEPQAAIACLITQNGVQIYDFAMYSESLTQLAGQADAELTPADGSGFKINQDSVTNDFGVYFSPIWANMSKVIIDASVGSSIFTTRWLNNSANGTAALNISFRYEFDMFTVAQYNDVAMNRSILTY